MITVAPKINERARTRCDLQVHPHMYAYPKLYVEGRSVQRNNTADSQAASGTYGAAVSERHQDPVINSQIRQIAR